MNIIERTICDWAIRRIKKVNDEARKHEILTEAVKHLFNTISAEDILRKDNGDVRFENRVLTPTEVNQIKAEARQLLGMKLWRVLKLDIKYQLNKKMFEEVTITADVLWGKLLLFYDDIIRTRLQTLDKEE